MDALLTKVTQHALNYAIRSGVAVTGGYAIKQCSRLLQSTPRGTGRDELRSMQTRLESKIRIISPAIDMIDLIAARGNTSLESAVQLTKDIRYDIQVLGSRLAGAVVDEDLFQRRSSRAKSREQIELGLRLIIGDMRQLLTRIEDAVPLINLAITTSGISLTTNLSATVSPSRLLQASALLSAADAQYGQDQGTRIQVGPAYILSMYMLFTGNARRATDDSEVRTTTWKEVIHKAKVKVVRLPTDELYDFPGTPPKSRSSESDDSKFIPADDAAGEFTYQILLIEDLEDGRVHTFDDDAAHPGPFDDVENAGIRDIIPIHQISKIFYADTGKILELGSDGESNSPVLLLKRDVHAQPPRRMMERSDPGSLHNNDNNGAAHGALEMNDNRTRIEASVANGTLPHDGNRPYRHAESNDRWRLPGDLDPEWFAFEVYTEEPDTDDEVPLEPHSGQAASRHASVGPEVSGALSRLSMNGPRSTAAGHRQNSPTAHAPALAHSNIKTSLSLLEMLIRLTALQQFRQASHLTIEDELLNFFLRDSSTTGAGPNAEYRQRVRRDARRRLGFDPYDESPMKQRGEEYIAHGQRASPYADSYYGGDDDDDDDHDEHDDPRVGSFRRSVGTPSPLVRHVDRPIVSSTRSSPIPGTSAHPRPAGLSGNGAMKGRSMLLRSQSEKPRSPLGLGGRQSQADSALGTSPSAESLGG